MVDLIVILRSPEAASQLLTAFATFAIMAAGFSLMLGRLRRFAARLFILGIFLVLAAAMVPALLAEGRIAPGWETDWIAVWLAVAGGGAVILGATSVGVLLLMPAFIPFVVFPMLPPSLAGMLPALAKALFVLAILLAAILVLKIAVQAIYGAPTAGHVAGTYLVRLLDSLGRGLTMFFGWPFRLWRRTRGE